MTVRVRHNPTGIAALTRSPGSLAKVAAGAQALANAAATIAPQGATGDLKASYKATAPTVTAQGVSATAYTDDFAGHWVEWGSINNTPYAPLRRGASSLGLRTRLSPKGLS